jgi:protocatechuate 3,4-dioxygenase beta subunit
LRCVQEALAINFKVIISALVLSIASLGNFADKSSFLGPYCTLQGMVVTAEGRPIGKAEVILNDSEQPSRIRTAVTDESGRFSLIGIEPGRYRIRVVRNGFVSMEYGSKIASHSGAILSLSPGQQVTDILFRLVREAAVAGTVVDEDNEPVRNVKVYALQYANGITRRHLMQAGEAETNDLGQYRIFGLAPRVYFVRASPAILEKKSSDERYVPTFYPATIDFERAAAVSLLPGDDYRADIRLVRTHVITIRGKVITSSNGEGVGAILSLLPNDTVMPQIDHVAADNGDFTLSNVLPGRYYLYASSFDQPKLLSALQWLDVSEFDPPAIRMVLEPTVEIRGRVQLEGKQEMGLKGLAVLLKSNVVSRSVRAEVKDDGRFELKDLEHLQYRLTIAVPAWSKLAPVYIGSARFGEQDILAPGIDLRHLNANSTLQIVLKTDAGMIDGTVLNAEKRVVAGAHALLIPHQRRDQIQLYRSVEADQNGHFQMQGITPGDYILIAVDTGELGNTDSDVDDVPDQDFVADVQQFGSQIHVEKGAHERIELNLVPKLPLVEPDAR